MPTKIFQSAIFDSDVFQINVRSAGRLFQNTIFDTDLFQQIHVPSNTISNVFQSDIFQKVYNGKLLFQKQFTISTSDQISKVFQSNVFDADLFQTTYTPKLFPTKIFQFNIFQYPVFQVAQIANEGKFVFQPTLFQQSIFDVPNLIVQTL